MGTRARVGILIASAAVVAAVGSASQVGAQSAEPATVGRLAGLVAAQHVGAPAGSAADPQLGCASLLDDRTLVGQTLMPGIPWDQTSSITSLLGAGDIGGWVVMGTPDESLAARLAPARAVAPIRPLVATDEEGGRVQRLRELLGVLPSAASQAQDNTPDELRSLIAAHATEMLAVGIDIDLAPVVDVGGGPGIGDRAFSDDPAVVSEYGEAVRSGLEDGGLVSVVKHFPGHGRASADSHLELPSAPALDELRGFDLEPFVVAIEGGAEAIMVAHLDVPGLTDGVPTSLSPAAVSGLLRDELGFDGLVMTDSLDMAAVADRWSTAEAVELALIAGNDVVLLGNANEIEQIHQGIAEALAAGRLDRSRLVEAATRVLDLKGEFSCAIVSRGSA